MTDRPPSRPTDPDIRFLDREELEALFRASAGDLLGPTDRALWLTAAMTGLRQGELAALRWRDVDWGAGLIRVRRSYSRGQYMTRDRSSFGSRDVLQALSSAAGQGAPVSQIMAVAKSFIRGPNAVRLLGARTGDVEPRYSTPELVNLERGVMDRAIALQKAGRGLAGADATARALLARPFLSGEQREMVRRLTQDGDGVAAVVGRTGTGKTTGLAAARDAWRQSDAPVRGCALSRRAARELDRLLERVTAAEGKLVLAGDTRQLPSIRGGALGALATRLDSIELRENRRQRETWEREAVELLRNRDGERALDLYERQGRLRTGRHDDEVVPHLVADWHAYGDPTAA